MPRQIRFGRHPSKPDDRDFPLARRLMGITKTVPGARYYYAGAVLDQLESGACVGFGGRSWLNGAPVMTASGGTPYDIYRKCVPIDEWTENDSEATDPDDTHMLHGTSVRALAKVLKALGRIDQYLWTQSADEVREFMLSGQGTVILGVEWYDGMMNPDASGFISKTGQFLGGHCIDTRGWDDRVMWSKGGSIYFQQSWGDWGPRHGFAYLSKKDLQLLLDKDGECLVAIEKP